jgi:hypothetical protein
VAGVRCNDRTLEGVVRRVVQNCNGHFLESTYYRHGAQCTWPPTLYLTLYFAGNFTPAAPAILVAVVKG